jgi:hypothetical protein
MKIPNLQYMALSFLAAASPLTDNALKSLLPVNLRRTTTQEMLKNCISQLEEAGYVKSKPATRRRPAIHAITKHGEKEVSVVLQGLFRPSIKANRLAL